MVIRPPGNAELEALARLWHEVWTASHRDILPPALARYRTLDSFRARLPPLRAHTRVADVDGEPVGFCIVEGDELYQLYVSSAARGSGIAAALLADGEQRIATSGAQVAWLACAIGNDRAARFYQKHGWSDAGPMTSELPTSDGIFPLQVQRFEKNVATQARPPLGVAHALLRTPRMEVSCRFVRAIGLRPIFEGPAVSVYEMRGATHLIVMAQAEAAGGDAAFDLMVDDLPATHARFAALGLDPSPIEARPAIDHHVFTVREPGGSVITVFSSHASGQPV